MGTKTRKHQPRPGTIKAGVYADLVAKPHRPYPEIATKNGTSTAYVYQIAIEFGFTTKRKRGKTRAKRSSAAPNVDIIDLGGVTEPDLSGVTIHGSDYGEDIPEPSDGLSGRVIRDAKKALTASQEQLQVQLDAMFTVGPDGRTNLQKYLDITANKLHSYSPANKRCVMFDLVSRHARDPEFKPSFQVASASKWEKLGRTLKSDAEGIKIWVRQEKKIKPHPQEDNQNENTDEEDEDVDEEIEEGLPPKKGHYYVLGGHNGSAKVYDYADTEGPPETDMDFRTGYEIQCEKITAPKEREDALISGLETLLEQQEIKLTTIPESGVSVEAMKAMGYYNRATDTIYVRDGLTPLAKAKTIAHELGHRYDFALASNPDSYYARNRAECETVAESVAHALMVYYGVKDSEVDSAVYLATWKPRSMRNAKRTMERIERAYCNILDVTDPIEGKLRHYKNPPKMKGKRNVRK